MSTALCCSAAQPTLFALLSALPASRPLSSPSHGRPRRARRRALPTESRRRKSHVALERGLSVDTEDDGDGAAERRRADEDGRRRDSEIQRLMWHPALFDPIRVPRNPIVLCHGLYGFDVRGPAFLAGLRLQYWGECLRILRGKVGAEVIVTGVPGTQSVRDRAQALHKILCKEVAGRDINILAHSMGGLDGRHLLTHVLPSDPAYQVRSLTTLSTPHRGSEFMAWCQANLGLGAAAMDADIAQAAVDATLQRAQQTPPPLPPWSLKEPLLSHRKPETEAKRDVSASSAFLPSLTYSLGSTLSSYLLSLIDSPAYANLTPDFLHRVFNPSTPNVDSTLYFSAAARIAKLGPWHPLWLPKTILDAAEKNMIASGRIPSDEPAMRGNDGLVNVDSARWGEFLGVVEACDHWQMRGAATFRTAAAPQSSLDGAKSAVEKPSRWGWEDVNTLVRGALLKRDGGGGNAGEADERTSRSTSGMGKLVGWIVDRVPKSSTPNAAGATATAKPAPPVSHRADKRADAFDLERLYVALCRRLYDEGL